MCARYSKPPAKLYDLKAIRRGLNRLDELATEPELCTPQAQERLAAYLEEEAMRKEDRLPTLRLPTGTFDRLDLVLTHMHKTLPPGIRLTRADIARMALLEGLQVLETRLGVSNEKKS